jgi:transcriptional regulator of acetoin/glycerol metabolism
MSVSLYDFLRKEVKKMVFSLGRYEKGNNNYLRASRALGIGRSTLYRRIEALGIKTKSL